ncbi:DUF4089 domain-containing protein [Amaricoccus solimangrovi]|uniref:DUF4089 domain-containing protein n=1 Tax=Amaricoccus solimangrovi TaxID=2589815 RepID=A0A501X1C5_9RHOB|nr:DUF4089 domain-containing protein [Amaricoccus solimangrovi]TPE53706.1 DUF4089 domain-containing protein [Amaricoccus solimangrovi]
MGPTDWETYLDAMTPAVGLTLDPASRAGVIRFLGLAAEMAARLEAVEFAPDALDLDATLALPEPRR